MIDIKILRRALIVGIVFQLALVGAARVWPWLDPNLLFGCMLIAGVAGLLYARDLGRGFGAGALGGAIAGAASGVAAVGLASLLGERADLYLPYGVMVAMLTGGIGGLFGELDVRLRALIRSLG